MGRRGGCVFLIEKHRLDLLARPGPLLDEMASGLAPLRGVEFGDLQEGDWLAAQVAVARSLEAAGNVELPDSAPEVLTSPELLEAPVLKA